MDQFEAHLERGWDLLLKGELKGARSAARSALQANKQSPEAIHLLGCVAQREGDAEEALEHFQEAIAIDEGFIEAYLDAAEVLVFPMEQFDEAIAMCDQVLEMADTDDLLIDVILLKFDAYLASGREHEAAKVLQTLPPPPYEHDGQRFLIARAMVEMDRPADALPLLETCASSKEAHADVFYYLGVTLEDLDDRTGASIAFLTCRELDMQHPRAPWAVERETFRAMVDRAAHKLTPTLQIELQKMLLLVSDVPGIEVVADGIDPRTCAILDGTQPSGHGTTIAERIFLYQHNIERSVAGIEGLEDEIAEILEEELTKMISPPGSTESDRCGPSPTRAIRPV
ncbi:MAG: tetratricopeptide repeat protein [Deltaproteobacteria bacterium]|nr:tetratricopeptide repeat protein [Deltaproteobacteria bacterium]